VEIDRQKPYATIYGGPIKRYEQEGVYFDSSGNEVVEKDVDWAKKQKGLGGRNLLMHYARDAGIEFANDDKIESVREKVIAHMS
jgi:hypothetical protein|tara:strand:- start:292 stop:543 length:252 start_codon:yes stop_codon:yes gene_type:complete